MYEATDTTDTFLVIVGTNGNIRLFQLLIHPVKNENKEHISMCVC